LMRATTKFAFIGCAVIAAAVVIAVKYPGWRNGIAAGGGTPPIPARLSCDPGANPPADWESGQFHFNFDSLTVLKTYPQKLIATGGSTWMEGADRILTVATGLDVATNTIVPLQGELLAYRVRAKSHEGDLLRVNLSVKRIDPASAGRPITDWPSGDDYACLMLVDEPIPEAPEAATPVALADTMPAPAGISGSIADAPAMFAGIEGLETGRKQISYVIGYDMGKSLSVIKEELDLEVLSGAIADRFADKPSKLTEEQALKVQEAFTAKVQARAAGSADTMAVGAGTAAPALIAGIEGLETERKQVSYMIGQDMAKSLSAIKDELDLDVLSQAIADQFAGTPPKLTEEQTLKVKETFTAAIQAKPTAEAEATAAAGKQDGAGFLAANKDKPGVQTTASGLQYEVVREGGGPRPGQTDTVKAHYRGTLLDGTVIDSSYDRGEPAVSPLPKLAPGLSEGMQLMPVGSKFRLWIPANLAFGAQRPVAVPPNATVVIEVELLEIMESGAAAAGDEESETPTGGDSKFELMESDLLRDRKTGLFWTSTDNGFSTTWFGAHYYCEAKGMRLPSNDELRINVYGTKDLRNPACGDKPCKVSTLFQLTARKFWTDQYDRNVPSAVKVVLEQPSSFVVSPFESFETRALCVSESKPAKAAPPNILTKHGGFKLFGAGRLLDTKSQLVWTQYAEYDVDWTKANGKCQSKGMRLPSVQELEYITGRPGAAKNVCDEFSSCVLPPLFVISNGSIWTSNRVGADKALAYFPSGNDTISPPLNEVRYKQALCVASSAAMLNKVED
jgi:FKBP-type peptidyl-prolyl cis-trans isomerase